MRLVPSAWLALAVSICVGTACGDSDTGIILEVTAAGLSLAEAPDQLAFHIGALTETAQGSIFISDPSSSVTVDVTGRDLATSPYRLLVHDGLGPSVPMAGAVFALKNGAIVAFAGLKDTPFVSGKILLYQLTLGDPGNADLKDTGCVTFDGFSIAMPTDQDCDGHTAESAGGDDCDDQNPHVNPDMQEICGNGIDDNCNHEIDESPDEDGDGVRLCDGDCDDRDPTVHPGAPEVCDGKDNDCNGVCDDLFDADGDGYTTCATHIEDDGSCTAASAPDCNDHDADIHPDAAEICDGKDNDCSGTCDEGLDRDGDGFTTCGTLAGLTAPANGICGAPADALDDCRDSGNPTTARSIHPFAHEFCDGVDDNCDGTLETEEPCFGTIEGPGNTCGLGTRTCDDDRSDGTFGLTGSCEAQTAPAFELDQTLCDAYDGACKDDPQPYRCATETAAQATLDCTVSYTQALGTAADPPSATVCPGSAPVPTLTVEAPRCGYVLVGGTQQEGYVVGLRSMGSLEPIATLHIGCDAELAVSAATNDFLPQPDEWVLALADITTPGPSEVIVIHVAPVGVAACPATPMSCTMRAP